MLVKSLFAYMRSYKKECILGPLFKLLEATFELLVPLVVANIVADVIMGLSGSVRGFLKPGGLFLCSGIIDERAAEVLEKLKADGWDVFEQRSSEGWFSYLCK